MRLGEEMGGREEMDGAGQEVKEVGRQAIAPSRPQGNQPSSENESSVLSDTCGSLEANHFAAKGSR